MNLIRILKGVFSIVCVCLLVSSCATLADTVKAKGTGENRLYDQPFEIVWTATLEIIQDSDLKLVSKDKEVGQILAQQGISMVSYGENVAIFIIADVEPSKTRVEIVSKKAMATNIFAKNWATYIFKKLDAKLTSS